jgi:hypothetical protein
MPHVNQYLDSNYGLCSQVYNESVLLLGRGAGNGSKIESTSLQHNIFFTLNEGIYSDKEQLYDHFERKIVLKKTIKLSRLFTF